MMERPWLITADVIPASLGPVEIGPAVIVSHVSAIHAGKDIREQIRNIFGGQMRDYETLLQDAAESAMAKMRTEVLERGFDGAYALRFSHPSLVDGGCEVLLTGTPFRAVK